MKFFQVLATATTICVGMLSAQEKSSYAGKTWVGLLVSGSCQGQNHAGNAPDQATKEADRLGISDRVTTPAVDDAGTRGDTAANRGKDTKVPRTGNISASAGGADPGWQPAKRQAASLGSSCRVTSASHRFGLLLPTGEMLRFDDLSDGKIARQLPPGGPRILRVQVVGKLQNGAIALDSIQM